MSTSLRQKVDAFFNPAPGGNEAKTASQMLDQEGLGYEDDGEHMANFFKGQTGAAVEVNKRNILADIAIQDGMYEGQKVSRADLLKDGNPENSVSAESDENDDNGFDESGEMEMEEGESAMSASSSESVPFG